MGSAVGNVAAIPWEHAERGPDRIAFRCEGRSWSYGRLRELIAAVGGMVRAEGIARGERVLLIAPSVPEFAAAYYGSHAAGATVVAMNPMATVPEISYVMEDAGCKLVIAWVESAAAAEQAAQEGGVTFLCLKPELADLPASDPLPEPDVLEAGDTAVILYTSGTTGRPKGAELTHSNLIEGARAYTEVLEVTSEDMVGTALPLFHVFGGSVVMGTTMLNGASLYVLPRFDPVVALRAIQEERLSFFAGVPTMYNALLQASDGSVDMSGMRLCLSGGASLPDEVLRAFEEKLGVVILEGYGLTETTGAATFNGLHRPRKAGYVGIEIPKMELRIVDGDGNDLPPGERGEVILRGAMLMKGYHGRPEATAEAIRDGWFHTGDIGIKEVDGDVRIVDRIKDLVIRGGYNVYPREVEEILYEHPDIVEVAVIGVDDPHFGEEVAAVVALRPGVEPDADALRAWSKKQLSAYKAPRLWHFVDELPKGPTGKILKRAVSRDEILASVASQTRSNPA